MGAQQAFAAEAARRIGPAPRGVRLVEADVAEAQQVLGTAVVLLVYVQVPACEPAGRVCASSPIAEAQIPFVSAVAVLESASVDTLSVGIN